MDQTTVYKREVIWLANWTLKKINKKIPGIIECSQNSASFSIQYYFEFDVFCLPDGLYSILNRKLLTSLWLVVSKWIKISLLEEEMWLGGIEKPQYIPIMGDVVEPPS